MARILLVHTRASKEAAHAKDNLPSGPEIDNPLDADPRALARDPIAVEADSDSAGSPYKRRPSHRDRIPRWWQIVVAAKSSPHTGREPSDDGQLRLNVEVPDVLLAEVDFKWLMAGLGWEIDMARLGDDPTYAASLLDWAMKSDSPALRECAATLLAQVNSTATNSKT